MTVTEYLGVLRRQWWLVVLLSALSLAGSASYTFTRTPTYEAHIQLFVSVSGGNGGVADLSSGSSFTQQRVKSYANIVTSQPVLQSVINEFSLPYTTDQLAGEVTASSPLDTVLLDVAVTDTSPSRAAVIANALSTAVPAYIDTLETPLNKSVSPVKVTTTKRARAPTVPVSPRVPLNLALGLLVGLGIGAGAAVLRNQLNTTISGSRDVEQVTGAVPLGVVPYDSSTERLPLVGADDQGGRGEAFRALRTNLQFVDVDHPPRIIVVTSPLPGDGKSTTSSNVAMTLALSGARVVLVEGDLRKPALGKYLGLSNAVGLTNVLAGQRDVRDVLVSVESDTITVLPSGPTPPNPSELLGSAQMGSLVTLLAEHYDYVVIDAPPVLPVTDAAVLSAFADGVLLVVRHGHTTRDDLDRAVQSLRAVNANLLGTVLNFAPRGKRGSGSYGYGYGAASTAVPRQSDKSSIDLRARTGSRAKPKPSS